MSRAKDHSISCEVRLNYLPQISTFAEVKLTIHISDDIWTEKKWEIWFMPMWTALFLCFDKLRPPLLQSLLFSQVILNVTALKWMSAHPSQSWLTLLKKGYQFLNIRSKYNRFWSSILEAPLLCRSTTLPDFVSFYIENNSFQPQDQENTHVRYVAK